MLPPSHDATRSDEWYELKGRLFRFFGTHPAWVRWQDAEGTEPGTWICGRDKDRERPMARDTRVSAVQHDPRLIPSRSTPEQHAFADVTAGGWNRLLQGIFTYLGGPARLDDVVTIAAVMLKLTGASSLPTGPAASASGSPEHLAYEQMDAVVENTLDAGARERIVAHAADCAFCSRQLAAYQAAALRISAPIPAPAQ